MMVGHAVTEMKTITDLVEVLAKRHDELRARLEYKEKRAKERRSRKTRKLLERAAEYPEMDQSECAVSDTGTVQGARRIGSSNKRARTGT